VFHCIQLITAQTYPQTPQYTLPTGDVVNNFSHKANAIRGLKNKEKRPYGIHFERTMHN